MTIGNGDREQPLGFIVLKSVHGEKGDIFRNLGESTEHAGGIKRNSAPTSDVAGIDVITCLNKILL